jgi:hypothetical protein
LRIEPNFIAYDIVKVIDLELLELSVCITEKNLNQIHIGVHGITAVIDHQDNLEAVQKPLVESDFNLSPVAGRVLDERFGRCF